MNTMQHAMQEAGIAIPPIIKCVWLWLKDHPEKTYTEIAAALGLEHRSVSQALWDLDRRKMLNSYADKSKAAAARGQERYVQRFSVKYKEFELLPAPKKAKPEPVVPTQKVSDLGQKLRDAIPRDEPTPRRDVQQPVRLVTRAALAFERNDLAKIDAQIKVFKDKHDLDLDITREQFLMMLVRRYERQGAENGKH